jgi:hypothetical protein
MIAPERAHLPRPAVGDAQHALVSVPCTDCDAVCGSSTTGFTPKKGSVAEPGLVGWRRAAG